MPPLTAHERRIARRLEARGLAGLGETLARLDGTTFGGRFTLERLFAAGAEGAVFLARDSADPPGQPRCVAKIPLLLYHRPIALDSEGIRRRRAALREEGRQLEESGSRYMPKSLGVHDMMNPLLDAARGGAFAEPEPVLVMERLPGFDLDMWLARMHASDVDVSLLRRTLDAAAVAVLQGLWDLQERGYYYADLRPGNVRIGGRDRRARLLDAGSMVLRTDCTGRFPHVPAYLPPDLFQRIRNGVDRPFPTAAVQAVMAGRTLFEVATGRVPMPGEPVDLPLLWDSRVSRPVADTIDGLCSGSFSDVRQALRYLHKHAVKRKPSQLQAVGAGHSSGIHFELEPITAPIVLSPESFVPTSPSTPKPTPASAPAPKPAPAPARRPVENDEILPPSKPKPKPWWRRLFGR